MVKTLVEQLRLDGIIVAPGVYDHVSLAIADEMGFGALFASGYWASASGYGEPDTGIVGMAEFVGTFSRFAKHAKTPVIADADTGFGSLEACMQVAAAYQQAGIAAFQIEDQSFPKICGQTGAPRCVDASEMEARIAAAVTARNHGGMLIVARTDARVSEGLEAAVARLARYHAAGADILLLEAAANSAEVEQAAAALPGPLMVNAAHGGRGPMLTPAEFARLGVKVVIYPSGAGLAAAGAAQRFYRSLASGEHADDTGWKPFAEVTALIAKKDRDSAHATPNTEG